MVKNVRTAWLLKLEGSQFGPFSEQEVVKILESGSLVGALYANRVGSKSWFLLNDVSQILGTSETAWDGAGSITNDGNASKRSDTRIALVATVSKILPSGSQLLGVCSDISAGGMQIINSTHSSFVLGESLDLKVHPIATVGMQPFLVIAKVAWIKPALKKVGFQFIGLEENVALKRYIETNKYGIDQFQA